jgi:hypothetical protein
MRHREVVKRTAAGAAWLVLTEKFEGEEELIRTAMKL